MTLPIAGSFNTHSYSLRCQTNVLEETMSLRTVPVVFGLVVGPLYKNKVELDCVLVYDKRTPMQNVVSKRVLLSLTTRYIKLKTFSIEELSLLISTIHAYRYGDWRAKRLE